MRKIFAAVALLFATLGVFGVSAASAESSGCSTGYGGSWLASNYHADCYARMAGGATQFQAGIHCWGGYSITGPWRAIGSGQTSTTALCVGGGTGYVNKR